jgi:hypothetical protein
MGRDAIYYGRILPFRRNLPSPFSILKMVAACDLVTLATFCQRNDVTSYKSVFFK